MNIRGVDFVQLRVSDFRVAARFYREVLGLTAEIYSEEENGWAEFPCGNVILAVQGGYPVGERRLGPRIALAVADIQQAFEELKRRGAPQLGALQDYGVCRAVEFADPDGNPLLLHQRADGTFGR